MKRLLAILLLAFLGGQLASAQESPSRWVKRHQPSPNAPFLGVELDYLDKATAAQLHQVPAGFGLLVERVEVDSPASRAGLQPLDVLWKLEDQLLANKGQLYSLMKMKGVGVELQLSVYRKGETVNIPVTLSTRSAVEQEKDLNQAAAEMLMLPIAGTPIRQMDYNSRTGFIEEGDVTVSLTQLENGYQYVIVQGGKEIHSGILPANEQAEWSGDLSEGNRRKLDVLLQSFHKAKEREQKAPRSPRVRRVPIPIK